MNDMIMKNRTESYDVFEGISILVIFLYLVNGSWWISTTNRVAIFYYSGNFDLGSAFIFIPILILGISRVKKSVFQDDTIRNQFVGICLIIAGFLYLVSSGIYTTIVYEYNYSNYGLINNLAISNIVIQYVGNAALFSSLLGIRNVENRSNFISILARLRYLLLIFFILVSLNFLFNVLMFSEAIEIEYLTYSIVLSIFIVLQRITMAIFLVMFCFLQLAQSKDNLIYRCGRISAIVFVSSTIINQVLININKFALDPGYYYYMGSLSPFHPLSNIIQIINTIQTISLYLTLIVIGIQLICSSIQEKSLRSFNFSSLANDLFKGSIFVLLVFFIIENNYFYSKPKSVILGVFLTIYLNEFTGLPLDAIQSLYSACYLIGTILVVLIIIRKHFNKEYRDIQEYNKNNLNGLMVSLVVFISLSMASNFIFRMIIYGSGYLDDITIFVGLTVVKGFEVLTLIILGSIFINNEFKGFFSKFLGDKSKLLTLIGTSLILQSIAGVGTIIENYNNLIDYDSFDEISFAVISNIKMLLYEISTILILVCIVLLLLDSVKNKQILHKISKILGIVIIIVLSVFKLITILGGIVPEMEFLDILINPEFITAAGIFDGFAAIILIYILMILVYGIISKQLAKSNINTNILSAEERISEFKY